MDDQVVSCYQINGSQSPGLGGGIASRRDTFASKSHFWSSVKVGQDATSRPDRKQPEQTRLSSIPQCRTHGDGHGNTSCKHSISIRIIFHNLLPLTHRNPVTNALRLGRMERVALVTGADRGLGLALTASLLEQEWTVLAGQYLKWPELESLSGKLHMLATPSGKRSQAIPDVPTIAESGLPGFDVEPWFGIVAPTGTPATVIGRLNAEITKIMQQSDVKEMLASVGATPSVSTPQEFAKFIDSEVTRWGEVVKASGATAD